MASKPCRCHSYGGWLYSEHLVYVSATVLADPNLFKDTEKSVPLLNEYHDGRETLEGFLLEWERLQEELARAKLKLGIRDDGNMDKEEEGSKGKHEKTDH